MIDELRDRWILDVKNERVVGAFERDGVCSIVLTDGVEIFVEGLLRLLDATEVAPVDALPVPAEEIEILIGAEVASAVAFKDGGLRVVFRPRYHLRVVPAGSTVTRIRRPDVFEWTGREGVGEMVFLGEGPGRR